MKKNISFKLWLVVLFRGIWQFVTKIARLFGYKEPTTFGKAIWLVFVTCFTTLFLMFTVIVSYVFIDSVVYQEWIRPFVSDKIKMEKRLSRHIIFQDMAYRPVGRVYDTRLNKVTIDDVDWVVAPIDKDSLAVFSQYGKKGYLNIHTGKVVLPAVYTKAWVFSEGVAAVEKDEKLVFIDHSGNVVINKDFHASYTNCSNLFRDGYCVVESALHRRFGVIDRQGNWVLEPIYSDIARHCGYLMVEKDNLYGLYSDEMEVFCDVLYPQINVSKDAIELRFPDHTAKRYDHDGHLLVDFVIDEVDNMNYPSTELYTYDDEDGNTVNSPIYKVAKCQRYMLRGAHDSKYYGLMDRSGKRLTPPEYTSIEAIGEDLYLCHPQGIIVNGKGQQVK